MKPVVLVGNDVVDLAAPRTRRRAIDRRFIDRVFAADEQEAISISDDPLIEVWSRWAAKETGFKVISKLIGQPPPFVHRAFRVAWSAQERAGKTCAETVIRSGVVRYEPPDAPGTGDVLEATVSVALRGERLHSVGFGTRGEDPGDVHLESRVEVLDSPGSVWTGSLEELTPRFTDRELDAVYSRQSAAVRLGARAHLVEVLEVTEERIEIVCAPGPTSQRPPSVLLDGEQARVDVSLSHDGQWISWAIWGAN